jgi:salicylate hydroxylase
MNALPNHALDQAPQSIPAACSKEEARELLIAGGGIAGLALGLALAKLQIPSHILERQQGFSEAGAGIQIGPNGSRILEALGVLHTLMPLVGAPESIEIKDAATGRQITRLPLGSWIQARHQAPYITLHRKDLHATLLDKVCAEPLIRLSMTKEVVALKENTGAIEVRCADGSVHEANGLIGADGIWSNVRSLSRLSGTPPKPAGYIAARTVIQAAAFSPNESTRKNTHLHLSPKFHAVHYPVRGGHEIALVVILKGGGADRDWNTPAPAGLLAPVIASASPNLAFLLRQAPEWRTWTLHGLKPEPGAARGRIALIGDAAHPILPFLAQGGVLALEDAITLAAAIARKPGAIPAALAMYAEARRARVRRVVRASRLNGRVYHMSGPLMLARNFTLSRSDPERLMAGYDWLYGWRAS